MRRSSIAMRLSLWFLLLLLLGGLAACARQQSAMSTPQPATGQEQSARASAALEVSVAAAIERNVGRAIEFTGTLQGQEEVTVSSEVEGTIAEVYVDFGGYVKAGDKLLAL